MRRKKERERESIGKVNFKHLLKSIRLIRDILCRNLLTSGFTFWIHTVYTRYTSYIPRAAIWPNVAWCIRLLSPNSFIVDLLFILPFSPSCSYLVNLMQKYTFIHDEMGPYKRTHKYTQALPYKWEKKKIVWAHLYVLRFITHKQFFGSLTLSLGSCYCFWCSCCRFVFFFWIMDNSH